MKATTSWMLTFLLLPASAAATDIEQLDFLAGHWVGADGEPYEEAWLAPRAGTIVGTFRWAFDDGGQVLEFLVIEETDEGIFFRFKHFGPDYVPWEKESPNTYKLKRIEGSSAVFEQISDNPDVPARLSYTRDGNTLTFVGTGDEPGEEPLVLKFRLLP